MILFDVWTRLIYVNLSSLREACSCFAGSSVFARAEFGNLAGWDLLVSLLQNQTKFWPFGSVWQRYNWLCYWMIHIKHRHQLWSIQQVPVQWFKYVCIMFAKACANIGDAGCAFIAGALQRPFCLSMWNHLMANPRTRQQQCRIDYKYYFGCLQQVSSRTALGWLEFDW